MALTSLDALQITGEPTTYGTWIANTADATTPNEQSANANAFIIAGGTSAGATFGFNNNATAPITMNNPVVLAAGASFLPAAGSATTTFFSKQVTAIPDTTATALFLITIPAGTASVVMNIMLQTSITQTSHVGDSTRVASYNLVVNREGTGTSTAALSTVFGAQQATTSGGYTITTTTLAVGTITGTTGTNTIQMTIANVNSTASTTFTSVTCQILGTAASVAAITLS